MKKKYFFLIGLLSLFALWQVTAKESPPQPMNLMPISIPDFEGEFAWIETMAREDGIATIVGIHGTPGSANAWQKLMAEERIQNHFNFVALDRPGWGQSQSLNKQVYPSFQDQADVMMSAFEQMALKAPVVLVAHSWGGPVALELAARFPNTIDGLILIASPASPKASTPRWYHKIAKLKLVQLVIGESMTRSNTEMLTLDAELNLLADELALITQPTVIMQGKKDWLVKAENAFYLQKKLTNAQVKLMYDLKANHFIPFTKPDEVVLAITWVVEEIAKQNSLPTLEAD